MSQAKVEKIGFVADQRVSAQCLDDVLSADEIPGWLCESYINNVLEKYYGDNSLTVKSLQVKQCGGKGDSYASVMYRIGVSITDENSSGRTKTQSYIVKTLPVVQIAVEKLGSNSYNVQNKEMRVYESILPEFKTILASVNEDAEIFPALVAVDRKLEVIVMEDLMEKNFTIADRTRGLGLEHTLMALRKLAKMHAASVILQEKNPNVFENIDTGFFTRKTDSFHVMFETLCDGMIEEVSTWEGYDYYLKKLVNVRKNLIKNAQRAFDNDEDDFKVLNHGDLWTTNIMYTFDENENPTDAMLIDFQFSFYGSFALDLLYFLFTSLNDDIRHRMEEFQQHYYYELKRLLTKLGYDMKKFPSLHEFHAQILKKYFYAFTSCLLIFPVMISKDKDADFESLMSRDARALGFKRRIFKNPRYQAVAKKILPIFDTKGILDKM